MSQRFAPDERETLAGMAKPYHATQLFVEIKPIDGGFLLLPLKRAGEDSAQDLSPLRPRKFF
jgi:hypothetical protein